MSDYISRDTVIKLITDRYECPEICTNEINSIPAANVVPAPVECGKCILSADNEDFKYCHKIHAFVPNDFGCMCGERKGGGEK